MLLELTEDRWRRLEALFHAARELPEGARAEFVEREAGELRGELEAMLARSAHAAESIASTIRGVASAAAIGVVVERRMGPYRLVREVGRGGMGVVFEACRDDDEYRKTVALKVAPAWRDAEGMNSRFRAERQILAGLEHPNIARFLDGGTEGGVPYFVMEYVEGASITEYCAARELGLRARIELFRQVCGAVHYAHENLVVHRDLKPANILVGRDGVPKLLDFGVAKLLDGPGGAEGVLTPDYGSPEQVRGGAVTTRTDVYSLGLILYEMLCGERAQKADTSSRAALERSICEVEPRPASDFHRQLRGDLDAILAMAMRKEPERRYSSAASFSEDLGRYLEGRPVAARPGTAGYRARKWAGRHRTLVAAALLLVVSVAGGVAATLAQARRAERRFQQVRGLANSMLLGVHDRIEHLAGATEAREWAVRTALEYLDNLAKDAGRDRGLLIELTRAYLKVGDVQGYPVAANLGHPQAALESYRKALSIAERLAGDPDARVQRLLAEGHHRVGAMLRVFRQSEAGIAEYRRALGYVMPLYRTDPGDPEDSELLITILISLGQAEVGAGRVTEANDAWRQALDASERWNAGQPNDASRTRLASSHCMVSRGMQYVGDLESASLHAAECLKMRQDAAVRRPADAAFQRELMNAYLQTAYVSWHPTFLSYGDRRTALPLAAQAVEIADKLAAADANNATAQFDLAIAEADYCAALDRDNPQAALSHCRRALAIAEHWSTQMNSSTMWAGMASALAYAGRAREALEAGQRALTMREELLRRDPVRFSFRQQLLLARNQMSELLFASGDRAAASEQDRQALALAEELAAGKPPNVQSQRDLADTYEALGRHAEHGNRAEALGWYRKSLAIWTEWPKLAPSTRMDRERRERGARAVARLGVQF